MLSSSTGVSVSARAAAAVTCDLSRPREPAPPARPYSDVRLTYLERASAPATYH